MKIHVNNKDNRPLTNVLGNTKKYNISDLQPGYPNSGSSKIDLVSGKMKKTILYTIIVQSR